MLLGASKSLCVEVEWACVCGVCVQGHELTRDPGRPWGVQRT